MPKGQPGPAAEELATSMQRAVRAEAWDRTRAVKWTFKGARHHLWDRDRQFARVTWKEGSYALIDLSSRQGRAFEKGEELQGEARTEKLDDAHAAWVNDAFWLNPVVKIFDSGTERSLVSGSEGKRGLLVRYTSGGRTPGDAYLWWVNAEGLPTAWQMWTSNIPVGGLEASWENWIELSTGAKVSTLHKTTVFDLDLTDVAGAERLEDLLPGEDPFAALLICADDAALCGRY